MSDLANIINEAWEKRNDITPADAGSENVLLNPRALVTGKSTNG